MRSFFFLLLIFSCTRAKDSGEISFALVNNARIELFDRGPLSPCKEMCAVLEAKITNNTQEDYLLYNFKGSIGLAVAEDSLLCSTDMEGVAANLILYDEFNKQVLAKSGISSRINWASFDTLKRVMSEIKESYSSSKLVLKKGESFSMKHKVDFWDFHLQPGAYKLRIIYVQLRVPEYFVTPEQIQADEKLYEAKLFNGCILSNEVKLTVE